MDPEIQQETEPRVFDDAFSLHRRRQASSKIRKEAVGVCATEKLRFFREL